MNTPTELYENHVHIKQQKQQNIPLLVKTTTIMSHNYNNNNHNNTATTTIIRNNNNMPNGSITQFKKTEEEEEFLNILESKEGEAGQEEEATAACKKNNKNLAKLNWWLTPFKPTIMNKQTIDSIIFSTSPTTNDGEQQQQQQQYQEAAIDETTNLLMINEITSTTTSEAPLTTINNKMPIIINNRRTDNNNIIKSKQQQHLDDEHLLQQQNQQQSPILKHINNIDDNFNDGIKKITSNNAAVAHDVIDANNDYNSLYNETTNYNNENNNENNNNDYVGLLNAGDEDEMQITGYRRSILRTILCCFGIILTGGILRLILYWWQNFYLMSTHVKCSLKLAEKVLIQENYNDKHKTYYIKNVIKLNTDGYHHNHHNADNNNTKKKKKKLMKMNNEQKLDLCEAQFKNHNNNNDSEKNIEAKIEHFSVHFDGEHFEYMQHVRLFNCKQLRYVWHEEGECFMKITGLDSGISSAYYHQQHGLTLEEQLSRRTIYGNNEITVPYRNILTLLVLEALNPFYVFQVFSVVLWFAYDYYYYAAVIVIMSVVGVSMSVRQTKKNQDRLRETVCNTGNALVISDKGEINEIKTQLLVPGDIIEIPTVGCIMQCDAILLSGNCIVDEAMLTGESIPITKIPLPIRRDVIYDKKEHARHTLFCGTKVIQTRYIGSEKVLAYVINTGNITAKGELVRSILYPPPVDYKFEQDSYKFIAFMAAIAAIGFLYTLITKIMRGVDPIKIVVESLDLITIVVPPALPAAMTVGRVYAQKRLKLNQIYCISPRAINVAGSIDCCCFDKTGTLTEEGLDMWGVVPKSATNEFQIPIRQIERLPINNFLFGMVTCHSITIMNSKMMGDPLDLKMFESTGWLMEDATDIPDSQKYGLLHPTIVRQPIKVNEQQHEEVVVENEHELTIVKRQTSIDDLLADIGILNGERKNDHGIVREFPFSSGLQRMSVITRRLCEMNFNVYCKGSPEMLQQLCRPETLPSNYNEHLASFAKQGYRIIAMGYKSLNAKFNYTKVQRLPREQVECDLEFLGFVILENRLKPDTTQAISVLRAANLRTIMITGDNMLTALSVARDCGIVNDIETVITVNVRKNTTNNDDDVDDENNYELYYTTEATTTTTTTNNNNNNNGINGNVNQQLDQLDAASLNSHTTFTLLPDSQSFSSMPTSYTEIWLPEDSPTATTTTTPAAKSINYRFALTGDTWHIVREYFSLEMSRFLTRGVIFARMSPEQKQTLVQELQSLDYCVSMCGDGANDCGALKVAHTGISLSETESSIASPFTSRVATIAAVPRVIKEGRAALVTSFGIFKYMATYSMIQFVSVMILYSIDANFSDKQYLYIDLGLISIFAFFFSKTAAYEGPLAKQVPLSSLIALAPLTSLIMHLFVIVVFQVTAWFIIRAQLWYTPFVPSDGVEFLCYENYALYAVSSFQYIIMAFVYSKGAPYRRAIWTNIPFCLSLIINLLILIYLIAFSEPWLADFFQLKLPKSQLFAYYVIAYGAIIFILHNIIEIFIIEHFIMNIVLGKFSKNMKNSNKKYLQIEYQLSNVLNNWPILSDQHYYYNNQQEQLHNIETLLTPPTYIELSAEPQHKTELLDNPALNSFFDVQQQQQEHYNTHM